MEDRRKNYKMLIPRLSCESNDPLRLQQSKHLQRGTQGKEEDIAEGLNEQEEEDEDDESALETRWALGEVFHG